jgi:hypothetical protein
MGLLRTIWPLERAIAQSRVGWTSQPITTVVLTSHVRGGVGPLPDLRRHALGESGLLSSLHIALSSSSTRSPRFTSRSNKALATALFANVVRRRPKPECAHSTSGRDSQRLPTTLNSLQASCVDRSVAQHHGCATQLQNHLVQHIARARRHKRAGRGRQARFQTVGPVRPTGEKSRWPDHRALLHDHDERATANRVSPEPDKEQDGLARYARRNKTKNKTVMRAASRRNKTENNTDLDRHWGKRRPNCRVTLELVNREPPKGGSLKTLASGSENLLGATIRCPGS